MRFDFENKLDLDRFKKIITHKLSLSKNQVLDIYLKHFRISLILHSKYPFYEECSIFKIYKSNTSEVEMISSISVKDDEVFKNIQDFIDIFYDDPDKKDLFKNLEFAIDRLCRVINFLHKINKLQLFT